MLEMCWVKNPEDVVEFHCSANGFSQMWLMFLHRPSCRLNPRGSTEFNSSFVNFGVTLPSNKKLLFSCFLKRKESFPFQIFTKWLLLLQTRCVLNCYPQNQSGKISKPRERNVRGIKAFSKLDLILQNKSLVQHSAKPFRKSLWAK